MRRFLTSNALIVSLVWLILLVISYYFLGGELLEVGLMVPRKVAKYYVDVMNSMPEMSNIHLLSAFDFQDGFITISVAEVKLVGGLVYCHYFDKRGHIIPDATRQTSFYTNTVARCQKDANIASSFISLSFSHSRTNRLVPTPIKHKKLYERNHKLAACVELELIPNWLHITSFIEYHRNLNFTFFHFTTMNLDAYTRRILDDYRRLGIAQITSLRVSKISKSEVLRTYKSIQKTNCLLQARFNADLVTFLRTDERVLDIPFFMKNLTSSEVEERRVVTKTVIFKEAMNGFINETETRRGLSEFTFRKHAQLRKVIDPRRIDILHHESEDFVYKKASSLLPSFLEIVSSSILSRTKYNYQTRPIYCDEFDITILSWCPVNVYHCQFRDEKSKKVIMAKREEARKVRYNQETIQW